MKNRRWVVAAVIAVVVVVAGLLWFNQRRSRPPQTVAIYNLVRHPILDEVVRGIRAELIARGYNDRNLKIVEVNAAGEMDKLGAYAGELLALRPDVIVPVSTPVTQAVVKDARPEQRVVFSFVTNPGDVGMDRRPPNLTGVSDVVNYSANIDLIQELFPQAKRIGMVYNAGERNSQFGVEQTKKIAEARGLQLTLVPVSRSDEVADAIRSLAGKVDVIYVGSDNTVVSAMPAVVKVAGELKLPVVASDSGSVEQGALAAVSVDYSKLGKETGRIVARLLGDPGMRAGDIQNVLFQGDKLVLNMEAAKRLGYTFPAAVRSRAATIIGTEGKP